ncbi:probable LRR receptor-like serine/threonine-protein kinase At1g05700 isoform X2 [Mercurialis annua]|uniref:probable LRR receptor-like serine/threonine-protein kinase At1g05700 isoform X2 n=1 Tax=Mercurialis annua TaxID=3986 RepID=UPI00215E7F57|nr:probable LRR receptor-like serine/threonine-protein kinase At1g05700 isoform X2 [Mercurialis annua]
MAAKCSRIWAYNSNNGFILLLLYAVFLGTKGSIVLASDVRRKLDDITGSINIDCGLSENSISIDPKTGIQYIPDKTYIDTGLSKNISSDFNSEAQSPAFLTTVRSFPEGNRNCYTLRPPEGKASLYLIRASFMYGNYDNQNEVPEFSLYLGVNLWDTVKPENASHVVIKEILHVAVMDNIYVCLVNTGSGTPFISALELRHFKNSTYRADPGSALALFQRLDFGSSSNDTIRYHDDAYDRIWYPYNSPQFDPLSTSFAVDSLRITDYNLPSKVMQTAVQPMNNESINFDFNIGDPFVNFYIYMHFAEVESIPSNDQSRAFNIELNGKVLEEVGLKYLQSTTISTLQPIRGPRLTISLNRLSNSSLPPIINAMEIYLVNKLWQKATNQEDVNAIEEIKSSYNLFKGWQGDPCLPAPAWDGLSCSDSGYDPPKIISLNLSSIGLTGHISSSLSNLKFLQNLDLSNNSLTGPLPNFLSQLSDLKTLNLEGNRLSGSVPSALIERSTNGSLLLRLDQNPELCLLLPCKEEKKNIVIPIVATIVPLSVIFLALIILWRCKKRKGKFVNSQKEEESSLKSDSRKYSYSEIVRITDNFSTIIGKGGFGTVYHGSLADGTQVAVKMLSPSSTQGSIQFRTEAHLLMRVHHRNLASFVGYCYEDANIGIIYEYMACGNLEQYLLDKSLEALTWKERLQIALDAAQGLEYLHHGCKPPIIHRDVKSANILLTENFQAKIADFGLSKYFPSDSRSHLSTGVVGTVGYLDPEYYTSGRLTERSDVYSFGVVLLEVITGQPAIIKNHDDNIHIISWVSRFIESGDIRNAVDPRLKGNFDTNSVWKFMETALSCVPSFSIQRPLMNHVVAELKECLDTEIARERSSRSEGQAMRLSNSFEMITVDLGNELGPEAR